SETTRAFYRSPMAAGLESLRITASVLRVEPLVESLDGLRHLRLPTCRIGDDGAATLARAAFFPRLLSLGLGDCALTRKSLAALARAGGLRRLSLDFNELGDASALGDAGFRESLEVLQIAGCWQGGRTLVGVCFPRLRQLDLSSNNMDVLGDWPLLHGLESL